MSNKSVVNLREGDTMNFEHNEYQNQANTLFCSHIVFSLFILEIHNAVDKFSSP